MKGRKEKEFFIFCIYVYYLIFRKKKQQIKEIHEKKLQLIQNKQKQNKNKNTHTHTETRDNNNTEIMSLSEQGTH